MCGIAGVVSANPVEAALLDDMARRLAHRGPDGQCRHVAGNVGLLHTRLAIIDLEGGAQPLYNEDRSLILVANGEIYNYRELRSELETLGHCFATHSDCETILHGYEAWGIAFLDRLQGMFAFALHDVQRGELILARDRLGIKPLYYCRNSRGLAFASEIKALQPWLGKPEVDPQGLAQLLQSNFTCAPRTLLQGVAKLPPAHLARIDTRTLTIELHAYWSPLQVTPLDLGLNDALERFDVLMQDVMDIHMRADVPLGLFLSGGVDSSLLAAMLAQRMAEPLRTFSVGFPGSSVHNELDAARRVAEQFHTRHSVFEVSADDMLNCLPRSVWAADDLTADYANLPVSMLAEQAGAELKVVFSGEGGDEVFAGYGRYRSPWVKRAWAAMRVPGSGGFRSKGVFDGTRAALFSPRLAEALPGWRQPFQQAWQRTPRQWTRLQRMQCVDLETWLPDDLLTKADRMLMAWGIEGRVPFLDHRVVEFGLALPDAYKIEGRTGKRFLRLWGERYLPREHLWARKKGFTVPVNDWLRGERLQTLLKVLPEADGIRAWFDPSEVRKLLRAQQQGGRHGSAIWTLLSFAVWHRIFVEGAGEKPADQSDPLAFIA
ncbi:asparagine synthase (glutamine-hydrolyzing) [Thiobacillus sp.]|uniref:asparagine synthase (glutamine-hydrolyzing) n=1 Tax=Thiobacillus sp. TaxID=924 RepID=UPI001AC80FD1|nr:asparagine synthase (glutamine-hydrolyzing) [Thiobacillus sp.]MBN8778093.1 asparagine synthase (glutamine-hydrolyzing) [Thiobacillus sp.]